MSTSSFSSTLPTIGPILPDPGQQMTSTSHILYCGQPSHALSVSFTRHLQALTGFWGHQLAQPIPHCSQLIGIPKLMILTIDRPSLPTRQTARMASLDLPSPSSMSLSPLALCASLTGVVPELSPNLRALPLAKLYYSPHCPL